ncbi:hypothetical protein K474DRAFT_1173425 [Panus rudis PR-1116 ss-1]|nr:hypothetical protein K474DRAFT_1173425 [Panus rudis PR-1116 ss-1]
MAALYLHNALFGHEPPQPPPSLTRRRSSSHVPLDRHLSSQSLVTLRTTTTEHSHPTEPLLNTAYLDTSSSVGHQRSPSGQPTRPDAHRIALQPTLSFESDPVSHREQRRRWELALRSRLRRLRWGKRSVLLLIGGWAVYTSIRYFIAITNFTSHDRRIILLVLGSVSAFSALLVSLSFLLSSLSAYLGWDHDLAPLYATFQSFLGYSSSLFLLGPAIVNIVILALWKHSPPSPADSMQGRCTWDIDAIWTSITRNCADNGRAVPWGFWLAGAIVRLVLTLVVVFGYHILSYKYAITRKPSRRRRRHTRRNSPSTASTTSSRSYRHMMSTNHSPVSVGAIGRQASQSTEVSECTSESGPGSSSGEHRGLRRTRSLLRSSSVTTIPRDERLSISGHSHSNPRSRDGHTTSIRFTDEEHADSVSSSDDDTGEDHSRYGSPIRQIPGTYSLSPTTQQLFPLHSASSDSTTYPPDQDLHTFVDHFRALVDQVHRETEAGLEFAARDPNRAQLETPSPPASPGRNSDDREYFPYMGHIIQRMPTIESLGSREVMSLATSLSSNRGDRSVHTLSRPPTRSNTLSMTDSSPPPSRSNSLTASIMLQPFEGPGLIGPGDHQVASGVTELGELRQGGSGSGLNGDGNGNGGEQRIRSKNI